MPQEHGTIKVPREVFEKHNKRRKNLRLTWQEYLEMEAVSTGGSNLDYDDVKQACRKAIRDELPEGVFK